MIQNTILQVMPDFGLAGAERMAEHLSTELSSRGWNVIAVSLFDRHTEITDELESSGIEVVYLGKKPGLDISMVSKLRRLFKITKPLVIHTHRYCMQYTIPASLGLRLNSVHTVHNIAEKEVPPRIQVIQKMAFRSGRAVPVAINETVRKTICDLYHLSYDSVPIVYNGVPACKPSCVSLPGDPDSFACLNIGRLMPQKNQAALIRAFVSFHEHYENVKLVIIGDGELRAALQNQIDELGASEYIFLMGVLKNARDYCYAADAFVLPSLYEGMPMTLVEAMMAGIPVLVSRGGGSVDLVQDGVTGYLCESDAPSIESALLRLYRDADRKNIGDAGRKQSLDYTVSAMADGYERVYAKWA